MKDNFSRQAEGYKTYRPEYPEALFEFIIQNVTSRKLAWDAGTGNGQTADVLARYFVEVIATHISPQQLLQAPRLSKYQLQGGAGRKHNDPHGICESCDCFASAALVFL